MRSPELANHMSPIREAERLGVRWMVMQRAVGNLCGSSYYLALRQHQTSHWLLVKHLQFLYHMDPGPQVHSLQQPAISWRGDEEGCVNDEASGLGHPQAPSLGTPKEPTCTNEQHCISGTIEPCDPVGCHVCEVSVLLHKQGAAPPRLHLILHQGVLFDEVEDVVRQLQRTGVAVVAVPIVDALCGGRDMGREPSAG